MISKFRILSLSILALPLAACLHVGPYTGPYTANSPVALVKPTHRAWLKPGTTEEDETQAMQECGDELRGNVELRKSSLQVWSDAYEACMNKNGFQYYKNRK